MPPSAVEVQVLLRVSELLREIADAVEDYARSAEAGAAQGAAPAVEPSDLADLVAAWNTVGQSLGTISGVAALTDAPRPNLTTVEQSLTTVRDIVRRQVS